ncbi:phosphomannomutase [Oxalobacteraceae bacterium R-40]|uniref:Phosphomannomutase n=1 Tax=Keguizhuia sedimenti TaxID=3064264 RepID=A0ABU1BNK4_9BURK|nr:phosphomannomutase [Oxalobacteraceae bacterium R-40]
MDRTGVRFGTSGIRGPVVQMTDETCYAYVMAFMQAIASDADKVILGHDLRPSSPRIAAACAAAIKDTGREPLYVGSLPTPAVACFASWMQAPAIVITGSHIPYDRNGIKFYRAEGEISKADEEAISAATVDLPDSIALPALPEAFPLARQAYVRRYVDFFGAGTLSGLTVAVYEHSSVARDILREVLQALDAKVVSLGRTDVFVPIDTEAVRAEDVEQARAWASEHRFDALVSTDGDADRPLIADEKGSWLRGDIVGLLCAQFLKAQVVVTPVSSNTAAERSGSFMKVLRTRIGSPYVIEAMTAAVAKGQAGVVGYEANGGLLLGSAVGRHGKALSALPTRDALLPILSLLCLMKENNCRMSELTRDLPRRFTASDRLQNIPPEKSRAFIDSLKNDAGLLAKVCAAGADSILHIDETDGLRVTFASQLIVHLRPSGNAPELRCYTEADSMEQATSVCESCLKNVLAAL